MAKTTEKKKSQPKPTVKETTSIQLNVPTPLYFKIKGKADKEHLETGVKKTIHDQMIDDLNEQNS